MAVTIENAVEAHRGEANPHPRLKAWVQAQIDALNATIAGLPVAASVALATAFPAPVGAGPQAVGTALAAARSDHIHQLVLPARLARIEASGAVPSDIVMAADTVLGRVAAGVGSGELINCLAGGRALLGTVSALNIGYVPVAGVGGILGDSVIRQSSSKIGVGMDPTTGTEALQVGGAVVASSGVYSTGVGATRLGFLDASSAQASDTYVGMFYDGTNNQAVLEALTGGVAWRNIALALRGGKVGIGVTPNGTEALQVSGNVRSIGTGTVYHAQHNFQAGGATTTTNYADLRLYSDSEAVRWAGIRGVAGPYTDDLGITIKTRYGANDIDAVVIKGNGLVGIGKAPSTYALEVAGDAYATARFISAYTSANIAANDNAAFYADGPYGGALTLVDGSKSWTVWAQSAGAEFCVGSGAKGGARTSRISINDSGKLEVNGAISVRPSGAVSLYLQKYDNTEGGQLAIVDDTKTWHIDVNAGAMRFMQHAANDGGYESTLMTLLGGKVGIGKAPSTYSLEVAGSVDVTTGNGYNVNGTKVVGAQGSAVTDASAVSGTATSGGYGFASATEFNNFISGVNAIKDQLNAALARLRTHGLIAT